MAVVNARVLKATDCHRRSVLFAVDNSLNYSITNTCRTRARVVQSTDRAGRCWCPNSQRYPAATERSNDRQGQRDSGRDVEFVFNPPKTLLPPALQCNPEGTGFKSNVCLLAGCVKELPTGLLVFPLDIHVNVC